jgi:hypothetical protein
LRLKGEQRRTEDERTKSVDGANAGDIVEARAECRAEQAEARPMQPPHSPTG